MASRTNILRLLKEGGYGTHSVGVLRATAGRGKTVPHTEGVSDMLSVEDWLDSLESGPLAEVEQFYATNGWD